MFYSYDKVKLGIEFKRIRLESRMTQEKVSASSGVNKDTIRRIEKGEVIPRYDTLLSLSKAYKRDLIGLMKYISPSFEITNFYDEMDKQIISFDITNQLILEDRLNKLLQWVGKESFSNQDEISQLLDLSKAIKNYHTDNFT